jgi:hypothetical protein
VTFFTPDGTRQFWAVFRQSHQRFCAKTGAAAKKMGKARTERGTDRALAAFPS